MRLVVVFSASAILGTLLTQSGQPPAQPLASGLNNPSSVAAGPGGAVFVSVMGEVEKAGDGEIIRLDKGKATTFASDLDDPRGIAAYQKWLYVADKDRIWRIDTKGKAEVWMSAGDFPSPPVSFHGVAVDREGGTVYVSDAGDKSNKGGAVYRINTKKAVSVVADQAKWPDLKRPTGIVNDGQNHLLLVDAGTGKLHRIHLASGNNELVAEGFGEPSGLAWDLYGRLYISDAKEGKIHCINRPTDKPVVMAQGFQSASSVCLDALSNVVIVCDSKAGSVSERPRVIPGFEVDESPLPIEAKLVFPKLQWTDWESETESGKQIPLRPIELTHAGDGSNRIFLATQHGVVHVFPNDPNADKTSVFLDIQKKVVYSDKTNEEGFLGLRFHPKYKENGQFFVFYTIKDSTKSKRINVVSRLRVSKTDPNKADPESEEEILRIERPFWNHDGGTIIFGPDGYLYVATGDGGSANDPMNNGQNLKSYLAKILRIDVDRKDPGKNYAIPKDNPFYGRNDAIGETWAYGLRNVWRMAFDRKTGTLWAGDVGQNLYEEIVIIVKGGNYGWKLREGFHPFSPKGIGPRKDLIEPIWEYHHSLGVSITGGLVYRGKQLPELDGAYLYSEYTNGKTWALRYDDKLRRVVANRPITVPGVPVHSFGEDEQGEVYFLTTSLSGRGIYQFQKSAKSN